jgi:hypothetical protein
MSKGEQFVGQCVSGTIAYAGAPDSRLSLDRSIDERRVSSELGFQVGAGTVWALQGKFSRAIRLGLISVRVADVTIYSHIINFMFMNARLVSPDPSTGLTPQGLAAKGTGIDNSVMSSRRTPATSVD